MTGAPDASARSRRVAAHRAALVARGALSATQVARLRGEPRAATETWIAREVQAHALLTVRQDGQTLVPRFQLTDVGSVRLELVPLLRLLLGGGVTGFALWTWLVTPSGRLGCATPALLAGFAPTEVLQAARELAGGSAATPPSRRAAGL